MSELQMAKRCLIFIYLADSIISVDRAYVSFEYLYSLDQRGVWFVTREGKNIQYRIGGQHQPIRNRHVTHDETNGLIADTSREKYRKAFHTACNTDLETGHEYEFLTNNMILAASVIATIYRSRWQVELFFRRIRQKLKIKSFLGTSSNAVLSHIRAVMFYSLLLTFNKHQTKYCASFQVLTRTVAAVVIEKRLLIDFYHFNNRSVKKPKDPILQLALF